MRCSYYWLRIRLAELRDLQGEYHGNPYGGACESKISRKIARRRDARWERFNGRHIRKSD